MGSAARLKPARLADKLKEIRLSLGLSQSELLRRLGYENKVAYTRISEYELGKREPPLVILLAYARAAGVVVEMLIDDDLELPFGLAALDSQKHFTIGRKAPKS